MLQSWNNPIKITSIKSNSLHIEDNKNKPRINYQLFGLVFSQIFVLCSIFIFCIWYRGADRFNEYDRLQVVEIFAKASTTLDWYYWVLVIGGILNFILLHFLLVYIDIAYIQNHIIGLLTYYSCIVVCYMNVLVFWFFLFFTIAANSLCDPLVRMFPSVSEAVNNPTTFVVIPLSLIDTLDYPSYPQETEPIKNGICVANTDYAIRGQKLATISTVTCVFSLLVTMLFYSWFSKFRDSFLWILFFNTMFILSIESATQLIFNEEKWDWRLFTFISYTFIVSIFNACNVLFCPDKYAVNRSIFHALSWMYLQFIDTIEYCLSVLFYPETTST